MSDGALIGRDDALAALRREAGFVLVTGPPGVGRSALLEAFAAAHPGPVRRATATPWESERAYAVADQLVPGIGTDPAGIAAVTSESGTLAVVDDAQWADAESVRALASTVRHHPKARLLIVAAAPAATDLLRQAATAEVPLAPLSAVAVGELAAARGILLHASMAERLTRHTGGIPRHVVDLLAEAPRDIWSRFDPDLPAPAGVAARVGEALAGCSLQARRIVEAVAVLGPATAVRDAALLAGVQDDLLAVLDEACGTGLVALGPRGLTELAPADPMVRAAMLVALGPATASELHRRAAELVDDPVRKLRLLVAATPLPDAALADELDELAGVRAADGAWGVAASLLSDAARLTEDRLQRESRLTRAVDALIGAGDVLGAGALVPEVEGLRETPLRNAVLGYLAIVRGRRAEAEARLARAWALVNAEREPDVAALICQRYVLHFLSCCRPGDLVTWADRAIAFTGADEPAAVEAAAIRGLGLAGRGEAEKALREYTELAERVQHGAQTQRIVMARGWVGLTRDAVDEAQADLKSSVPTTVLGGSSRISLWAGAWLARARFLTGDWDDAVHTVREAQAVLDHSGIALVGPLLQWTAVAVHALRGETELAAEALRRADSGPDDYEMMRVPLCLARAQLAEVRTDAAAVLRALRPLTSPRVGCSIDEPGQWPWADMYAHALVIDGRYAEADAFLVPHEKLAAERGLASARARLAAARGRLEGTTGELDRAKASFGVALELLEGLPLRYDRARIEFTRGQILRRAGKRREADEALTTARETFAALGAVTYVDKCDRELKAGGVHLPRGERGHDELTPQETAVSRLVAKGLSNRDVATELYLSTKTVQYHLTRVYAKLGIRSRAELAARLNS
ncbi:helix-turn-helix transcriptional regulator [Amycolatopsis acidicola]|uniref:Helix-turn-helix transcriptional regulator n=1 Tax=Amycolatopsis acidicola TaxID=2596893 RepID=A0A5N0US75_9PSEU|nr:LuxR family transcriptional regulator [Amycolatopsis acidicola]KAA9152110.1 helix-turn-helix transcriptional regulator [Amycolatopsis acidicola]